MPGRVLKFPSVDSSTKVWNACPLVVTMRLNIDCSNSSQALGGWRAAPFKSLQV